MVAPIYFMGIVSARPTKTENYGNSTKNLRES